MGEKEKKRVREGIIRAIPKPRSAEEIREEVVERIVPKGKVKKRLPPAK